MSIAIFHEHDECNEPLFAELSRRALHWVQIDGSTAEFDPTEVGDWDVLVNRMSPSAWTRGHMKAMLQTPEFLHNVESAGIPVINGSEAYDYELSKSFIPPTELIEEARRIIKASGADLGGVEYLINDRDGEAYFYDINALSNFVADATNMVGFDPFVPLADFIEDRARLRALT